MSTKKRPNSQTKMRVGANFAPPRGAVGQPEWKYLDVSFLHNGGDTMTVTPLSLMATGDTASTREGNLIHARRIEGNFDVTISGSATNDTARMLLVIDKRTHGAYPAANELLVSGDAGSLRNPIELRRFDVLMDKRIALSNVGGVGHAVFSITRQLSHEIEFYGPDATEGYSGGGSLYMFAVTVDDTYCATLNGRIRFWFSG